jgi:hypothetical protein
MAESDTNCHGWDDLASWLLKNLKKQAATVARVKETFAQTMQDASSPQSRENSEHFWLAAGCHQRMLACQLKWASALRSKDSAEAIAAAGQVSSQPCWNDSMRCASLHLQSHRLQAAQLG